MGSRQVGLLLTVVMLVLVFDCGNCNTQRFEAAKSIRVEDSTSILHRNSRSNHRYQRSVPAEMKELLGAHNRLRRLEGASNMELMIWDNELAIKANVSAYQCNWIHSNNGQNLYSTEDLTINFTAAVQAWYDEKTYYYHYFNTRDCQEPKGQCLHYSQVVWATSRKLGCAYTRCQPLNFSNFADAALLLVCNYDPPGNVIIDNVLQFPYLNGTGCSQCTSGSWWCSEGLCNGDCSPANKSTCGCAPVCLNSAAINTANCSCSCAPGWYGSDCNVVCKDLDSNCDPPLGVKGYQRSFCDFNNATSALIAQICPKMCKLCRAAVGGGNYSTSTKPSLLTVLLVWLSWILLYSFRGV